MACRQVNLVNVLKHELMPVPLSLAEMDGSLCVGNKSSSIDVLMNKKCVNPARDRNKSTIYFDSWWSSPCYGPRKAKRAEHIWWPSWWIFKDCVEHVEHDLIELMTGTKNIQSKILPDPNVFRVVTQLWNLLTMARFYFQIAGPTLWHWLKIKKIWPSCYLIATSTCWEDVSGCFKESTTVKSSNKALGMTLLQVTHEEADTRIVSHCDCTY